MNNDLSINKIIEQAVSQYVQELLESQNLSLLIEKQIINSVRPQLVDDFFESSGVSLSKTVELAVSDLFEKGNVPGIEKFVDHNQIRSTVDNVVQDLVSKTIDNLIIDPTWQAKIENVVNLNMSAKISRQLSKIDLNQLIVQEIDVGIERWQDRIKKDFRTNGFEDTAESIQLSVTNDGVALISDTRVGNDIHVERNAVVKGTLEVENLVLKGRVNTDNASWRELTTTIANQVVEVVDDQWRSKMVADVVEHAKNNGIEFAQVYIDGHQLVENNSLSPKITESNLEKVGTLKALTTHGVVNLSDTVHIVNGRIGVNTDSPEMALSVWDEEVCILAGKMSEKHAYIGTSRLQNLSIGVNRQSAIEINDAGITAVKHLQVDRFRIGHSGSTPGHSGNRGDFLINSDLKPGQPFAWLCLGGFKWQSLFSNR